MSAHRLPTDLWESPWTTPDPGASQTITVFKDFEQFPLVSATTETRTLARPTRQGCYVMLYVQTYAGSITVAVTGNFNTVGSSNFVFTAANQWALFASIYDGTNYYWYLVSSFVVANGPAIPLGNTLTTLTSVTAASVISGHPNGQTYLLSALAGINAVSLPAATGSGVSYTFKVKTVPTSNSYIFTFPANTLFGTIVVGVGGLGGAADAFTTAQTGYTTLTLAPATSGALSIGDWFTIQDVGSGVWYVTGIVTATTPAAPFV